MNERLALFVGLAFLAFSSWAEGMPGALALGRPELAPGSPISPSDIVELPGPCPGLPQSGAAEYPDYVDRSDALADLDTYFDVLRWCYSGYFSFGGDEAFGPARARIRAAIQSYGSGPYLPRAALEKAVGRELSFVTDVHFAFGSARFGADRVVCIDETRAFERNGEGFYLSEAAGRKRVLSVDGSSPAARIKPSLDGEGRLIYRLVFYGPRTSSVYDGKGRCAVAQIELEAGAGASERLSARIAEVPSACVATEGERADPRGGLFSLYQHGSTRVLALRSLFPSSAGDEALLKSFAASGSKLRGDKAIVMDLRGNGGGSDSWSMRFMGGFAGSYPDPYAACYDRRSAAAEELVQTTLSSLYSGSWFDRELGLMSARRRFVVPAKRGGTWSAARNSAPKKGVADSPLVLLISDRRIASSGESLLGSLRMLPATVQVGAPTAGCVNFGNVMTYILPRSRIEVRVPMSRFLMRAGIRETVGYEPDIWVPADAALSRAEAFLARYGAGAIREAIRIVR
jgi:hypothetical protein